MGAERLSDYSDERSRRLPPLEAWRQPDRWMNVRTGLALPDAPKLVLPTDSRGFIKTNEAVESVNDFFFWKDYDWPYTKGDMDTQPDAHHFYYNEAEYLPGANKGSYTPMKFRENPMNIGIVPRQFHNTLHDFTRKETMPSFEDMDQFNASFLLVQRVFRKLYVSAKQTSEAAQKFPARRQALERGLLEAKSINDSIGEAFMREFFEKHFRTYSEAIEQYRSLEHREMLPIDQSMLERTRPHIVAKKLGKFVTMQHVNYVQTLRAA